MTPLQLLESLIRFDTTNPPGHERACIELIDQYLQDNGFETTILAKDPERPNLIARLPGRGDAPPLLFQGHVDVVTTEGQQWSTDPFEPTLVDDNGVQMLQGRGTLDMKGGVAMMISSVIRAKESGIVPAGDIVLCILSDEEAGGELGAKWLVENHPERFKGIRYAIGEFGGFNVDVAGKRFTAIQIAEKRFIHIQAVVRGPGGHGSGIYRGETTMAKTAAMLTALDQARLPIHVTPAAELMLNAIADQLSGSARLIVRQLLNPALANLCFRALSSQVGGLEPLLRNTTNATLIKGGIKRNVIPSEVVIDFDSRLLPGISTETFIQEVRDIVGPEVEIHLVSEDKMMPPPDMKLFPILADIMRESDPTAEPAPIMLPAVTDARYFSQLGIQTYGFTPILFPDRMAMTSLIHGANERIPVDAVEYGTAAIVKLIERYVI